MKTIESLLKKIKQQEHDGIIEDVIVSTGFIQFTYKKPFYDMRDVMYIKDNIKEIQDPLFNNFQGIISMNTSIKDFRIIIKISHQ
jgi:hypothetical protein